MSVPAEENRSVLPRNSYIGGSAAATILGKNEFENRLDLYDRKVNNRSLDLSGNGHVIRGNLIEPYVESWIKENVDPTLNSDAIWDEFDYGKVVRGTSERDETSQIMLMDDALHPDSGKRYIGGHPDGIGDEILWEFKVPTSYKLGRVIADGLPASWYYQVQHYMMISGRQLGCVATFNTDRWEPHLTWVDADPYVHEVMREEYEKFWGYVVRQEQPPEDAETVMHSEQQGVVHDARIEEALAAYDAAYTKRYEGKDEQTDARLQLLSLVGDRRTIITAKYKASISKRKAYGKMTTYLTVRKRDQYED
jgi:hypothetical protein